MCKDKDNAITAELEHANLEVAASMGILGMFTLSDRENIVGKWMKDSLKTTPGVKAEVREKLFTIGK